MVVAIHTLRTPYIYSVYGTESPYIKYILLRTLYSVRSHDWDKYNNLHIKESISLAHISPTLPVVDSGTRDDM